MDPGRAYVIRISPAQRGLLWLQNVITVVKIAFRPPMLLVCRVEKALLAGPLYSH